MIALMVPDDAMRAIYDDAMMPRARKARARFTICLMRAPRDVAVITAAIAMFADHY